MSVAIQRQRNFFCWLFLRVSPFRQLLPSHRAGKVFFLSTFEGSTRAVLRFLAPSRRSRYPCTRESPITAPNRCSEELCLRVSKLALLLNGHRSTSPASALLPPFFRCPRPFPRTLTSWPCVPCRWPVLLSPYFPLRAASVRFHVSTRSGLSALRRESCRVSACACVPDPLVLLDPSLINPCFSSLVRCWPSPIHTLLSRCFWTGPSTSRLRGVFCFFFFWFHIVVCFEFEPMPVVPL